MPGLPVGGIALGLSVERHHRHGIAATDALLPPTRAAPGDHAFEMEVGNDALIGRAPALFIDARDLYRIFRLRFADLYDFTAHASIIRTAKAFARVELTRLGDDVSGATANEPVDEVDLRNHRGRHHE